MVFVLFFGKSNSLKRRICKWASVNKRLQFRSPGDASFEFGVHFIMPPVDASMRSGESTEEQLVRLARESNRQLCSGEFEIEPKWFYYALLRFKLTFDIKLTPFEAAYVKKCKS